MRRCASLHIYSTYLHFEPGANDSHRFQPDEYIAFVGCFFTRREFPLSDDRAGLFVGYFYFYVGPPKMNGMWAKTCCYA